MTAYRKAWTLAFIFPAAFSFGQQVPQRDPAGMVSAPVKVRLEVVSTVQAPSLPAQTMALPVLCSSDGTIFIRLATVEAGTQDPVSVSSDGKTIIRFGREKISDIPSPVPIGMYLGDSDVYMLTLGSVPLGHELKWRRPDGQVESHPASKSSSFVARFHRDGTYAGAVALDVPFRPLQLGVFANGDFLVAGTDQTTGEPHVAIVGPNGQLLRSVELVGDVHAQKQYGRSGDIQDTTALPRFKRWEGFEQSLKEVVSTSQIASDGPNLLLFRPVKGPVFSISPSGEVRVNMLKVQGDYRVYAILATQGAWIAEFTHHLSDGTGDEFSAYSFDPTTGAPLKEFIFPRDLGYGLACTDGNEFTFVMANDEVKTLRLLKLAAATASSPN